MIDLQSLTVIGKGMTADVFKYQDGRVLKLFHERFSNSAVEYEGRISEVISQTSIRSPKYYGSVSLADRRGLIYEYIEGQLLFPLLMERPDRAGSLINKLALNQLRLHETISSNLPNQIDRLSELICKVSKIDTYKPVILSYLAEIPHQGNVCHGDYHVGNIIQSGDELVVIDWMNCYSGDPVGDVVRTYLMFISPFVPPEVAPVKRVLFKFYKAFLGRLYLRAYLKASKLKRNDLRKWIPIIAAARLSYNVPNEEKWLISLIKKNIKFLTHR